MKYIEGEILTNFIALIFIIMSFDTISPHIFSMAMLAMNARAWINIYGRWE